MHIFINILFVATFRESNSAGTLKTIGTTTTHQAERGGFYYNSRESIHSDMTIRLRKYKASARHARLRKNKAPARHAPGSAGLHALTLPSQSPEKMGTAVGGTFYIVQIDLTR